MDKIPYYCIIGFIVSMDAMALTIAMRSTFSATKAELVKWAGLNALWHGGLLASYAVFVYLLFDGFKSLLNDVIDLHLVQLCTDVGLGDFCLIKIELPDWILDENLLCWLRRIRIHLFAIASSVVITYVWYTYSKKIVDTPIEPKIEGLNWPLRKLFRRLKKFLSNQTFKANLQAALVAMDMLALAALIKLGNQDASLIDKGIMTCVVAAMVFALTMTAALIARWNLALKGGSKRGRAAAKLWIQITLRLAEPLLIFYFLLQVLAYIATGYPIDTPVLLFAAAIMVLAMVEVHGFTRIVDAARSTPSA
jgi:hypothetical protein